MRRLSASIGVISLILLMISCGDAGSAGNNGNPFEPANLSQGSNGLGTSKNSVTNPAAGPAMDPVTGALSAAAVPASAPNAPANLSGGNSTITSKATAGPKYVVIGFNEQGLNWIQQDYSELMIMAPGNNFHAQVIKRGLAPKIVNTGVVVKYSVPGNTYSVGKTNFWDYSLNLLGVSLAANKGLSNKGLSGKMKVTANKDWAVLGVPLTPMLDTTAENPCQFAAITVTLNGKKIGAASSPVIPVSWEINCNLCHGSQSVTPAADILAKHDSAHGTNLKNSKPVRCAACHTDTSLGKYGTGVSGMINLSRAIHGSHADRMAPAGQNPVCIACHPGISDLFLRDVHATADMTCTDCHTSMTALAGSTRKPWVDEPKCGSASCHVRSGFTFEQPGKLYHQSKGHRGVMCATCHGAAHALGPAINAEDNAQAIALQGHSGKIDTCTVCHTIANPGSFNHNF